MRINWLIIVVALIYGFFLARYFYYFHKVLPKEYSLFKKNLISHLVLIAVIVLIIVVMRTI